MINNADLVASDWNSANYLTSEEDIALYLQACIEEGGDDPVFISHALATIAQARQNLSHDIPLSSNPSQSLSGEAISHFANIIGVLKTFGLKLSVQPV